MIDGDRVERSFEAPELIEVMEEAVKYNRFLIEELLSWSSSLASILDFGAGNGRFAVALHEQRRDMHAIEPDPDLRAKKVYGTILSKFSVELSSSARDLASWIRWACTKEMPVLRGGPREPRQWDHAVSAQPFVVTEPAIFANSEAHICTVFGTVDGCDRGQFDRNPGNRPYRPAISRTCPMLE